MHYTVALKLSSGEEKLVVVKDASGRSLVEKLAEWGAKTEATGSRIKWVMPLHTKGIYESQTPAPSLQ